MAKNNNTSGFSSGFTDPLKASSNPEVNAQDLFKETENAIEHYNSIAQAKGSISQNKNALGNVQYKLEREAKMAEAAYSMVLRKQNELVSGIGKEVSGQQKIYDLAEKRYKAAVAAKAPLEQIKKLEDHRDILAANLNQKQKLLQTEKNILGQYHEQRAQRTIAYTDAVRQTNLEDRRIRQLEKERHLAFGSTLVRNRFNVSSAAKEYGWNKMVRSMPESVEGGEGFSALGMGGGLAAAGAGAILGAVFNKVVDTVKRSWNTAMQEAQISKTATGLGTTSADFRSELRGSMRGYGVSMEESAQLAGMIRPLMGAQNAGDFGGVLRNSVAMDRAYGMQLGTGAGFMGQMVRQSSTSGSEVNKLSFSIAEAIGRGKLVGLQEELLRGVQSLVELTRHANINGPNAGMFAQMIGNVSSLGFKNLRGEDAARAIGNISQGIANPNNPFGQLLSVMAIRDTLAQRGLKAKDEDILMMQSQGLGLNVGGKDLGMPLLVSTLKRVHQFGGGNKALTSMALANTFNISPQVADALSSNADRLGDESFRSQFGLEQLGVNSYMNVGNNRFLSTLGGKYTESVDKLHKTDLNANERQAVVQEAIKSMVDSYSGQDKERAQRLFERVQGTSAENQVREFMKFGEKQSTQTPEDKIQSVLANIDFGIGELVKYLIPPVEWIADKFTDYDKASADKMREEATKNRSLMNDEEYKKKIEDVQDKIRVATSKSAAPETGVTAFNGPDTILGGRDRNAALASASLAETGAATLGQQQWEQTVKDRNNAGQKFVSAGFLGMNRETLQEYLNNVRKNQKLAAGDRDDLNAIGGDMYDSDLYSMGSTKNKALRRILGRYTQEQVDLYQKNYVDPSMAAGQKLVGQGQTVSPELRDALSHIARTGGTGRMQDIANQLAGQQYGSQYEMGMAALKIWGGQDSTPARSFDNVLGAYKKMYSNRQEQVAKAGTYTSATDDAGITWVWNPIKNKYEQWGNSVKPITTPPQEAPSPVQTTGEKQSTAGSGSADINLRLQHNLVDKSGVTQDTQYDQMGFNMPMGENAQRVRRSYTGNVSLHNQ
jgi:hypothetical protein